MSTLEEKLSQFKKNKKTRTTDTSNFDEETNSSESTTDTELEKYEQDIDGSDILIDIKKDIGDQLADILLHEELDISIVKESNEEEVDEELTDRFKKGLRKNDAMNFIKSMILNIVLNNNGKQYVLGEGDIDNPRFYLSSGFIDAIDIGDMSLLYFSGSFDKTTGPYYSTLRIKYSFLTNTHKIMKMASFYNEETDSEKTIESSSKERSGKPKVELVFLRKDQHNNPCSVFYKSQDAQKELTMSSEKSKLYVIFYAFKLALNEKLFTTAGGSENRIKKAIKGWFGHKKAPFTTFNDQVNLNSASGNQPFQSFDPSLDNEVKSSMLYDKKKDNMYKSINLIKPSFEGKNQKSEEEVRLMLKEERAMISNMVLTFAPRLEKVLSLPLPAGYKAKIELNQFDSRPVSEQADLEFDKLDAGLQDEETTQENINGAKE